MYRAQTVNNLKQIGLALQNYQSVYGRLPPPYVADAEGKPLYSWRVLILPFLEAEPLYAEFHLDEPWSSPHNAQFLRRMPLVFRPLGRNRVDDNGRTNFLAVVGPGSAFEGTEGQTIQLADGRSNFPDGTDATLAVVEARGPVPWTKPVDFPAQLADHPSDLLGSSYARSRRLLLDSRGDTFAALFADGRVRSLRLPIPAWVFRALVSRNGGEAVSPDDR